MLALHFRIVHVAWIHPLILIVHAVMMHVQHKHVLCNGQGIQRNRYRWNKCVRMWWVWSQGRGAGHTAKWLANCSL